MSKHKTWTAKAADLQNSDWFVVDATDQVLGRLASGVAKVLRGKHKPTFTPHLNSGDHVIVINAARVKVTGTKGTTK
ncbi:MAG: 50S ribosomal protein L13, partial [Chloroflexi bacterium]